MLDEQHRVGHGAPRRVRRRGRRFRVRLNADDCAELDRLAAERHVTPEVLLASIDRVVLRDGLVGAVLDDMCSEHSSR